MHLKISHEQDISLPYYLTPHIQSDDEFLF